MRLITTLIVDDERLARQRIRRLLSDEPDIEVVGECLNIRQAAELARAASPDLLFLDIQMPKGDGFQLLEALRPARIPFVIFITAYEQHALRAFDFQAQDYLLKPFQEARFRLAVERARESLGAKPPPRSEEKRGPDVVLVRSPGRVAFLKTSEIDWIESADNYVRLHAGRDTHIVRETMAAFECKLHRLHFARIHRSTIVNIDRIAEVRPWFNGDFLAILKDGRQLRMSRTFRDSVQDLLGRTV